MVILTQELAPKNITTTITTTTITITTITIISCSNEPQHLYTQASYEQHTFLFPHHTLWCIISPSRLPARCWRNYKSQRLENHYVFNEKKSHNFVIRKFNKKIKIQKNKRKRKIHIVLCKYIVCFCFPFWSISTSHTPSSINAIFRDSSHLRFTHICSINSLCYLFFLNLDFLR